MKVNLNASLVTRATESPRSSCAQVRGQPAESCKPPRKQGPLINLARKLHDSGIALQAMHKTFRTLQGLGLTLTPNHFYWPIPDYKELENRRWPDGEDPIGIDLALQRQSTFLQDVIPGYQDEWISKDGPFWKSGYTHDNGFFEAVDAEIAYCLVRCLRPRRIVEVGGGYSTRVLLAACEENHVQHGVRGELITIDPYPDRIPKKFSSDRIHIIPEPIQNVDLAVFLSLGEGDFLFLDSSHVVGVGSDVVREYLEILPRVERGVMVHAHDIFIPSDYPREMVLKNLAFWSEQYLLQAFLTFNPQFEVVWASSAMQSHDPEGLERAFPRWKHSYRNMSRRKRRFVPTADGDRVWPSSFWLRKVG